MPGHEKEKLDDHFMAEALKEARKAEDKEEVPVGAVIVHENRVIARAHNQVELLKDATAHAEMIALTQAESYLGDWRLDGATLYVTKEPCFMCSGALVQSRVTRLVYGARDVKAGGAGSALNLVQDSKLNHWVEITAGVREEECKTLIQEFFKKLRAKFPA